MFAVLTYTDCAAGDSVNGRSGFQFQAESAGATQTDEERIRNGLLHVVPVALAADRPELHPPTCVFAAIDGRYYLSRGRSTGQTLSGRPGNQLTETIVTGLPSDILPLRPAQLFSAPLWALERAPAQQIAGWEAPLEIDPTFETSALHEMVASDTWLHDLLPSLLTMVEQTMAARRVKLILAHSDQVVIMRLIALASLFEEGGKSLSLSFRVFSPNPLGEPAHIVGVHPLVSPHLAAAPGQGYNLVDLERRAATPITVSPTAAMHASWFLGHDPYEALDATETSRRWSKLFPPRAAAMAAAVACLHLAPGTLDYQHVASALTALSVLAKAGQAEELEAYADQVLDAVVAWQPEPGQDIAPLTSALWDLYAAKEDGPASGLALVGLEWAALVPSAADVWGRSHALPKGESEERCLRWPDAETAAHAAELVGRVLAGAPEELLAQWFSLARSLATGLSPVQAGPQIERLGRYWACHPELTPVAFTWLHVKHVVRVLQDELCRRLGAGDPETVSALAKGRWDWLIDKSLVVDPERSPLSPWLVARALDAQPLQVRLELLRKVSPIMPSWASVLFLGNRSGPVEPEEILLWLEDHSDLSPQFAQMTEAHLAHYLGAGRGDLFLALTEGLRSSGATGLTSGLANILSARGEMESALGEAQRLGASEPNAGLAQLAGFPRPWLALYAAPIAELVVAAADQGAIVRLSRAAQGVLDEHLGQAVLRFAMRGDPRALTATLRLMHLDPRGLGRPAQRALASIWDEPRYAPERDSMLRRIPKQWRQLLKEFEGSLRRRNARGVPSDARRTILGRDGR